MILEGVWSGEGYESVGVGMEADGELGIDLGID